MLVANTYKKAKLVEEKHLKNKITGTTIQKPEFGFSRCPGSA